MHRRRALHVLTALTGVAALTACGRAAPEETAPATPEAILAAAGFAPPPTDAEVTDGTLKGDEPWSRIVTFAGTPEQVDGWIRDSFDGDLESRAYEDDQSMATERLGEGIQKKGDRIASGVHGSVAFVVVVGQEADPVVHAAVRRTGR